MEEVILQVKGTENQKRITIPKNSKIKVGDYVKIKRLKENEN